MRGDLDWIVMKSLEKDRTRRYETANGLARDIRRHLDGEPVEASPPSARYRLGKFARKHRAALATAASFMLVLVAATAISVSLALWANRERVRAVKAEKRAQEREQMAIDAVRRFSDVIHETPELKDDASLEKLRATLLKEPQAFFRRLRDRLQADRETTPESLGRLGKVSFDLGKLTDEIGDKPDALLAYEESLAIFERLARENPSVTHFQNHLAASFNNIGELQREAGRPAEALASYERARAILERLAREAPSVTQFLRDLADSEDNIGLVQRETGRPAEALASHGRALAIRQRLASENRSVTEPQNAVAVSHLNIGNLQRETGRPAEAMASFKKALAIQERLACEKPESPDFASNLGATLNNIAVVDLDQRRFDGARAKLTRAVEWQRKALAANPKHPVYRQFLANHLTNMIRAAEGLGDTSAADEARLKLSDLKANDPEKAALDARLAAVMAGQPFRDGAERIALATRAYERALHASSARFYCEALATAPELGGDRQAQHRYNAASAASLAAAGLGKDTSPPDDAAKSKFRRQALDWLKAELSAWRQVALTAGPGNKEAVAEALEHWKVDADLAGLRDAVELTKLPEPERAAFHSSGGRRRPARTGHRWEVARGEALRAASRRVRQALDA